MTLIVDCMWRKRRTGSWSVENILAEAQRAKRIENKSVRYIWHVVKKPNTCVSRAPKVKERKNKTERLVGE